MKYSFVKSFGFRNAYPNSSGYIARLMKIFGTKETAKLVGVSERRICAMIKAGILDATKVGRDWIIGEEEVLRAKRQPRPPGRPRSRK